MQEALLTLARNARTSVEMIERFHANKLNGEMNIEAIQSKREKSKGLKINNSPSRHAKAVRCPIHAHNSWTAKAAIEAQYGGSFVSWWRGPTQIR